MYVSIANLNYILNNNNNNNNNIPNALSSTSHSEICFPGILFPHLRCTNLATTQLASYWAIHDVIR